MNLALALLIAAAGLSGTDRSFLTLAMNGNTSEIYQGQIFADSADRLVQSFAQRITTDHSQANTQLIALAHSDGVSTSGQLPDYPSTMRLPSRIVPRCTACRSRGS
jgi:predicted outer membrane protein